MSLDAYRHVRKSSHAQYKSGNRKLTATEKHVLSTLALSANQDGRYAVGSLTWLSRATGLNRRTVRRLVQMLTSELILTVAQDHGKSWAEPTVYHLNLEKLYSPDERRRWGHETPTSGGRTPPQEGVVHPPKYRYIGKVPDSLPLLVPDGRSDSSSSKGARARKTTTTAEGLKAPEELVKKLLAWKVPEGRSGFDRNAVDSLWRKSRSFAPACTPDDVLRVASEKFRTHYTAGKRIDNWVGFLLTAVPKAIEALTLERPEPVAQPEPEPFRFSAEQFEVYTREVGFRAATIEGFKSWVREGSKHAKKQDAPSKRKADTDTEG